MVSDGRHINHQLPTCLLTISFGGTPTRTVGLPLPPALCLSPPFPKILLTSVTQTSLSGDITVTWHFLPSDPRLPPLVAFLQLFWNFTHFSECRCGCAESRKNGQLYTNVAVWFEDIFRRFSLFFLTTFCFPALALKYLFPWGCWRKLHYEKFSIHNMLLGMGGNSFRCAKNKKYTRMLRNQSKKHKY